MTFENAIILLLFLHSHLSVKSQVPTDGCNAISNGGACFSYFTSSGVYWEDARQECLSRGSNLATVKSLEEDLLMLTTIREGGPDDCWIGLNDIENEGVFVWADGSNSTFRNFYSHEPNNLGNEDCVHTWGQPEWNDEKCTRTSFRCYFCRVDVKVFGQVTGPKYSSLANNTVLTTDTTLYCVTENKDTPQVLWSHVDLDRVRTNLISVTNSSTGVSIIQVYTTQPGYYMCEVSENGGVNTVTYTAEIYYNKSIFGQVNETAYSPLTNNTIITSTTTLYCVTDSPSVRGVLWSYVDLSGVRTNLTSTTNATTGLSTLQVYNTHPGNYICELSQNGGINTTTFTTLMKDTNIYTVPPSGCGAISSEGTCFSYFTSTGINWEDARLKCVSRGYDIATVTSMRENSLMYNTATASSICWIGLHDIDTEGTFVWADGSNSLYRQWNTGEPNNADLGEDCAHISGQPEWNDQSCAFSWSCYYCSSEVNIFGQVVGSTYSQLADDTVLTSNTTLYCVTENSNTLQVVWNYLNLDGIKTGLTSTTDASTGVSIIQVYTTQPGYYTCVVSQNGGNRRAYTVIMTDTHRDSVPTEGCNAISEDGHCYTYYTSSGINWEIARLECVSRGYDIATVTSQEENTLMYNTYTSSNFCWIGLNDRYIDGTFVWADGSNSTYRQWSTGILADNPNSEDCAMILDNLSWDIQACVNTLTCFFCDSHVNAFGQITGSTYSSLADNTVLTSNTTLYCVTENKDTPQVLWSYVDLSDVRTNLTTTTDASSGVSIIQVDTTQPGYYTCEVSQNGGMNTVTYTAVMTDTDIYTVPTSGCNAISDEGVCFTYFTSSGINWEDARLECASRGYDIATVTSIEENTLMYSTATDSSICWIGLNDIDTEGVYVWADGSYSHYAPWYSGQPDDYERSEDCVNTWNGDSWSDASCTATRTCFFCSSNVNAFGQVTGSTYSSLPYDTVLTSDTTLYCVTDSPSVREVMWSYVDLSGVRTDLTSTTDSSTGVSIIQVYTTLPGYYTCEVSHYGGMIITRYTVGVLNINSYTAAVNDYNYRYTIGVDEQDVYLWYSHTSVPISDIFWKLEDTLGNFLNPLDVYSLTYHLNHIGDVIMECFDIESRNSFINVGLLIQGPPLITLSHGSINSFSLLPPQMNRADVNLLTQDVILSTNLVGRWQEPDDSFVTDGTLTFSIFHQSDEGLYKFYVTNWDGDETLAIQIYLTINESSFGQLIDSITYISLTESSILTTNTTLYCVAEDITSPQVVWSYTNSSGTTTILPAVSNDVTTGISTLHVYSNNPGYYSCEVMTDTGAVRIHRVRMLDTTLYTEPENGYSYTYTSGMDGENIFLFCNTEDSLIQLSNLYWRREDRIGFYPNPLDLQELANVLKYTNNHDMECFDIESGNEIMSVKLLSQGPPLITLSHGSINSFSLLSPQMNRADVNLLTQDVILSANLVGRWQKPDDSFVTNDSLTFSIFRQSDEGLYKFYVTNWDGDETLAIQINISVVEATQSIINLKSKSSSDNSILITWSLQEPTGMYSDLTFSVYFKLGEYESLAGTTTDLSYEITGIPTNVNYSIRVESQIPYSTQTISATLYHYLESVQSTPQFTVVNNNDNTTTIPILPITTPTNEVLQNTDSIPQYSLYIAIVVIVILLILFFFFFITLFVVCCIFRRRTIRKNRSHSTSRSNPMAFEMPANPNPTFGGDDIKLSFFTDKDGIHSYIQNDDTNQSMKQDEMNPSQKQDEADVVMENDFSSEIFASVNFIS